jgi:hypothetical protein
MVHGLSAQAPEGRGAGGAALQHAVAERWRARHRHGDRRGLRADREFARGGFNPLSGMRNPTAIGIPAPGTDVRLVDDDGQPVAARRSPASCGARPAGDAGLLAAARGDRQRLRDGWLHTGDVAVMDGDGYFRIVDRKKDMILVSGFNVYPNEVEDAIAQMDEVLEVAVIGVPDAKTGEAVRAYVVPRGRRPDRGAGAGALPQLLTDYKVPKRSSSATNCPRRRSARSCARTCARVPAKNGSNEAVSSSRRQPGSSARKDLGPALRAAHAHRTRNQAARHHDDGHHARHGRVADLQGLPHRLAQAAGHPGRAACQYGIMPLLGYLMAGRAGLPPALAVGLILMGCMPGGTTSNIFTYFSKGVLALSIMMTICSTLVAVGDGAAAAGVLFAAEGPPASTDPGRQRGAGAGGAAGAHPDRHRAAQAGTRTSARRSS